MATRQASQPRTDSFGLVGWVLFDWAGQPFYTLVLTFLFAPYFANVMIGDSVHGQALWGYATGVGSLIVALMSPPFGAIADTTGHRKAYVFACSLALVAGLAGLWLAAPGSESLVLPVLACFVLALVAAELATVITNAMMPGLVAPGALGRLSGIGWAIGYVGGLVSLVITAGLLIADPGSGRTMFGLAPLLPLDAAAYEGDRLVGPFCAVWYALFMIPFFLWTPDRAPVSHSAHPVREGFRQLARTIANLRHHANVARFLLARLLYIDGLGAVFAFGGIYAASVFGWTAVQLGIFGIVLTVTGALGAAVGGFLDDRLGSRAVILTALVGLIAGALGIVSIGDGRVLFVVPASFVTGASPFATPAEQLYLGFAVLIGVVAGPLQAASRSLLARMAPAEKMTEFFGLFAFSGKVTAFAAPLLVGAITDASDSQRIGIAAILLFLIAGGALMLTVREE